MTARQQVLFWLGGLLVAGALLYLLHGILLPFVAGIAVAYLLDPAVDKLETWGLSRTWATATLSGLFFALITAAALVLYPVLQNQVVGFFERLPDYVTDVRDWLVPLLRSAADRVPFIEGPEDVVEAATGLAEKYASWLASAAARVWSGGLALFNLLSLVLITPVVAFYLLRDWDDIVARVDGLLPRVRADVIREQIRAIDRVLAGFVRGQTLVSLALSAVYGVGLTAVGLEFGLVIGLATGILSFIPFVGMVMGFATAIVVGLLQWGLDPLHLLLVAAVFAAGQGLESAVLQPRLLGGSVGLHPVWVIFGVLAGGVLFGFVGVLLAVPVTAAAGVLVRFALGRYRDSSLYQELSGPGAPGGPGGPSEE